MLRRPVGLLAGWLAGCELAWAPSVPEMDARGCREEGPVGAGLARMCLIATGHEFTES